MTDSQLDRRPRTSWFGRMTGVVRSWFRPTPVLEVADEHVIDRPFTFEAPAVDDSFPFLVSVRLQWKAIGRCDRATLNAEISRLRERWRWFVDDTVRQVTRDFPPYRAREAEAEVNRRLKGLRVVDSGIGLECTAVTRLTTAPPIVTQQQAIWQQRLEREARLETVKRDINHLRDLRARWRDFLSEGMDDWITPYAVQLAETPTAAAAVTENMLNGRRQDAQELLETVKAIMDAHQATDVFEFVASSETVLRNTLQMMGLPVPDPVPGSVFTDPDDDTLGFRGSR